MAAIALATVGRNRGAATAPPASFQPRDERQAVRRDGGRRGLRWPGVLHRRDWASDPGTLAAAEATGAT
eukprot:4956046-Alexandrium_andersonii.AAC.1